MIEQWKRTVGLPIIVTVLTLGAPSAARSQDAQRELSSYLDELHEAGDFNGAVGVALDGQTLLARGYGFADFEHDVPVSPSTKFRIGSITKQFTAMAIMILQERGSLGVRDQLGQHLTGIPDLWADLTIHQLLTHTSGIMHSWALRGFAESAMVPATLDETLARFHREPLLFEPGSGFQYSGVGYFLLAKVIEVVSGVDYATFLRTEIFDPLGMADSGADRAEVVVPHRARGYTRDGGTLLNAGAVHLPILTGGGNLYSTAADLLRWGRALTAGRLISEEGYQALYTPDREEYAYGWRVGRRNGSMQVDHGGGLPGYRSMILRVPDAELCVVVLTNIDATAPAEIAERLAEIVLGAS